MKRTNILAIAVLLLMSLFISSCENEKLEPTPTRQSISPSDFITHSQSAVENINEFYRQNSDLELEARSGELSFEELWGSPNYNKLIHLRTLDNDDLLIIPLEDSNTTFTHNMLVGWQQEDSVKLRIVHDNRTLSSRTSAYTPIRPTISNVFNAYNLVDPSIDLPYDIDCFSIVDCPADCVGCITCIEEIPCDTPGSGGGGNNDEPADNNTNNDTDDQDDNTDTNSGGGSDGETTDPDCIENCATCEAGIGGMDEPDCVDDCAGYYDTDCNGMIDDVELCLQLGIGGYNCSLAAQDQALLDLLIENADTPENLALISAPGILVSTTCASSFDYVPVGNGFTAQVNDVGHSYFAGYFGVIWYKIPELCIQVSGSDANGVPLTATKAAQLSAYAMDNARYTVFDRIQEGLIVTNTGAKDDFRNIYRDELIQLTGGQTTSSISYGPCLGSIPETAYTLAPLGFDALCIKMW